MNRNRIIKVVLGVLTILLVVLFCVLFYWDGYARDECIYRSGMLLLAAAVLLLCCIILFFYGSFSCKKGNGKAQICNFVFLVLTLASLSMWLNSDGMAGDFPKGCSFSDRVKGQIHTEHSDGEITLKSENAPSSADAKIFQLNEKVAVAGENTETGENIQMQATVGKVIVQPESMVIYYQFEKPKNIVTSGIKDIAVVMKNGKKYDLWTDSEDKSMSYDKERNEAVTYIVFSEPLTLQDVERIKVADQYLAVL